VDAVFDDLLRWRMVGVEGAWQRRGDGRVRHQMPPTKRPGFRVFFGSN
jgi:hypothetical protein